MGMALDTQSEESDAALLAGFARGEQSAARALTARHLPRIFAHAYRLLQDKAEAEDVAQDAMLKLWKVAPNWREGEAKISTWLYRVTANAATDRLRKRRTVGLEAAPEQEDTAPSVEAGLIANDRQTALRAAMDALPERQRHALVLRHFEELSNPEIASALETSVEAVESLLGRARRALADKLSHLRPAAQRVKQRKGART
ncbi:MAG: RNA polymerase sigma factor [Rhodobacteraceae bacterium]|nr:RNA polymerase sigma factor [Paracoccaceae bacterium]